MDDALQYRDQSKRLLAGHLEGQQAPAPHVQVFECLPRMQDVATVEGHRGRMPLAPSADQHPLLPRSVRRFAADGETAAMPMSGRGRAAQAHRTPSLPMS